MAIDPSAYSHSVLSLVYIEDSMNQHYRFRCCGITHSEVCTYLDELYDPALAASIQRAQ